MKYSCRIKIGTMLAFILTFCACAPLDKSLKSYTLSPNVEQYFQDKYNNQVDEVKCDFQETPHGPKGHLALKGRIDLNNEQFRAAIKNDRFRVYADDDNTVRPLAKYFIQQESRILGIVDLNEWQDALIIWTTDYYGDRPKKGVRGATITYFRYINGVRCLGQSIRMHITEDDDITLFEAYLEPASTEIYNAASKTTISEEEVARIINHDLKSNEITSHIPMAKLIINKPPYVIWSLSITKVYDAWLEYDINAFTGEIVSKRSCSGWRACFELEITRDRNKKN